MVVVMIVGVELPEPWDVVVATLVVVLAAVVTSIGLRFVLTRALRWVAERRRRGRTALRWRIRFVRPDTESQTLAELRRRRRIDAAAVALARIAAVGIWVVAIVVVLHLHDIGVGVALSGAGFLGLVVAFSAQHSVNDYLTGLHVLLEDRYGEGDEIELATASGDRVRGTVVALGAFSTTVESDTAVHHLANRMMSEVTNHSQIGVVTTLEIDRPADEVAPVAAAAAVEAVRERPSMPEVVVEDVDELDDPDRAQVTIRSAGSLGDTDRLELRAQLRRLVDEPS